MTAVDPAAPDAATGIALLRASIADDEAGQAAILGTTDPALLLAVTAGMALALGQKLCGSLDAFDAYLARCQQAGALADP